MPRAPSWANTNGTRRPVSADAVRLPAVARPAEHGTELADGMASAILDTARTALNKERAMRQQARTSGQVALI